MYFYLLLGGEIDNVNTICLPLNYPDSKSWNKHNLVVAGWGWTVPDTDFQNGISNKLDNSFSLAISIHKYSL